MDAPVSLLDIAPTLLDWAGAPAEGRLTLDGRSLVPLLDGAEGGEDRVVISEFHTDKVKAPCFMVRKGPYKYIYIHGHRGQLFHLPNDPGEWENLIDDPAHRPALEDLRGLLLAQFDPEWIVQTPRPASPAASCCPRPCVARTPTGIIRPTSTGPDALYVEGDGERPATSCRRPMIGQDLIESIAGDVGEYRIGLPVVGEGNQSEI